MRREADNGIFRGDRRSGQMVVFVTMSMFFLFSVVGLSVDLGYSYVMKIAGQAAADSAASAAAIYAMKNGNSCGSGITCNSTYTCLNPPTSPPTTAFQAGCLYAQANGYVNAGNQSVTLIANNTTPPNETGNSPALWVQANVSQTVNHLFLFWSGFQSGPVAAQAIAGISTIPASNCIYILSSSATDALNVTGNSSITASGCGIYVNSTNGTAINVTGSSVARATGGSAIDVAGGYYESPYSATISPTPTTVGTPVTDPFLNLPAPTVSASCYQTNYNAPTYGTASLNPPAGSVFCGGITAGGSVTLNLSPGTYILNGGGLNIGGSATLNGTGVTFFFTGQHGYTAAGLQLSGASQSNLSAPGSGTYQGVLFYQDRSVTYAAGNAQAASAGLNATGSFYFPTTSLSLSGAVSLSKIALIVNTLSISGSSSFQQDLTGTYTGLATKTPALIQ